jgi:hypothetical protein
MRTLLILGSLLTIAFPAWADNVGDAGRLAGLREVGIASSNSASSAAVYGWKTAADPFGSTFGEGQTAPPGI